MSKTINVQVTLDAQGIMQNYPSPSQNQNSPTGIAHKYGFMVATSGTISGSGTGDLNFQASVGDTVRFFGTTASNNFEDAALIYGINRYDGDNVFNPFYSNSFIKQAVTPSGPAVLPAAIKNEDFWFFSSSVSQAGTENYKVVFALYKRNDNNTPVLFGYYQWDPTITVNG